MNVKELKKLAYGWWHVDGKSGGRDLYDAIMALPDDPQAEHEDLVEMAHELNSHLPIGDEYFLASAVIERFGKKEPRKVESWAVMIGENVYDDGFESAAAARKYLAGHPNKSFWLARLTGTEEV